uniref:Zgc:194221 n=1 Tax=Sander lucioperca TaxID=283035 RepID=A0A8D0D400_SANLU
MIGSHSFPMEIRRPHANGSEPGPNIVSVVRINSMMDNRRLVNALAVALLYWRRKQKKKRSVWVKYYLAERNQHGEFHRLVGELRLNNGEDFRVSRCQFDEILHRVGPRIKRINTWLRRCICPAERLTPGDSYHSLSYLDVYMPVPKESDWQDIAEQFRVNRDFPNCVGAIDGKHVRIVSAFGHGLQEGTLGVPPDAIIPGAEDLGPFPHTFVGDEAFPLRRHLMRPYPGRNLCRRRRMFNYCMSQARMVVEQAFGELAARFRIYHRVMWQHPHNVEVCVKATCVLHNLLRRDAPTHPSRPRENRAPNPPTVLSCPVSSDKVPIIPPWRQFVSERPIRPTFPLRREVSTDMILS